MMNLPVCRREACKQMCPPGVVICGDCSAQLIARLSGVDELMQALITAESHGLRFGQANGGRGGNRDARLPFNERAADARRVLEAGLADAARFISIMAEIPLGATDAVGHATFIAENLRVIRSHPDGVAQYGFLSAVLAGAERAVDGPPDLLFLGQCGEAKEDMSICEARVYARVGSLVATCVECRWEHEVDARRASLMSKAADVALSPTMLARAIAGVGGVDVTPKRIQKWAENGKITPVSYTPDKRHLPMYRVQDVLDVLTEVAERRTRRSGGARPSRKGAGQPEVLGSTI